MSVSILRNSARRAAANARLYSTAPPQSQPGPNNTPVIVGVLGAGAVGYYFYKRSEDANKGILRKKGEQLDAKAQEAKAHLNEKAEEAKARYEQGKSDAGDKVEELKKEGAAKYESAKQSAVEKGQEIQKKAGDKISEAGKDIKDRA